MLLTLLAAREFSGVFPHNGSIFDPVTTFGGCLPVGFLRSARPRDDCSKDRHEPNSMTLVLGVKC
jgi:hypothetical protein